MLARNPMFDHFVKLSLELQIIIIQQIDNDQVLCSFLSVNKYMLSIFHTNADTIFRQRVNKYLTEQSIKSPFMAYRDYVINKNKKRPFIKEVEENHTILSYMVFKGYEKAVSVYLKSMASREELRHKVGNDYNLLHLAILSRNPEMVALILAQPEAIELINEKNVDSNKAIHFAARVSNRLILKNIIEHAGFNRESINENNDNSYSPLANFCKYGADDIEFLKDLICYGAKTDESEWGKNGCGKGIPAGIAIQFSKPRVARVLLKYIKTNIKNYSICPDHMLSKAIKNGYTDIVKILVNECQVNITPNRIPDESLLKASLSSYDLELIRIVFKLESVLYEKASKVITSLGWIILPGVNDYMLCALGSLFITEANSKTFEIYNLLIELGFNISMTSSYNKENIFHFLAANLKFFVGNCKNSIHYAQQIISDLLQKDLESNYTHTANNKNVTPIQVLPNYNTIDVAVTFEEKVTKYISELEVKNDNEASGDISSSSAIENYSHDNAYRFIIQ